MIPSSASALYAATHCLKPTACAFWAPRTLSKERADEKMEKNLMKAFAEHRAVLEKKQQRILENRDDPAGPFLDDEDLGSIEDSLLLYRDEEIASLRISSSVHPALRESKGSLASLQGRRESNQDRVVHVTRDEGILYAVFDGHGGEGVAEYAATVFKEKFFDQLKAYEGNIHRTFEYMMALIHWEYQVDNPSSLRVGTTVVVSFVDPKVGRVYTATLGDSEAFLFRKRQDGAGMSAIPLSNLRDWSYPKEAIRVAAYYQDSALYARYTQSQAPKTLRFPKGSGVNISRALGDQFAAGELQCPVVIHKPKITCCDLVDGDQLLLASDGLFDAVPQSEIAQLCSRGETAEQFAYYAINTGSSADNVSVIVQRFISCDT